MPSSHDTAPLLDRLATRSIGDWGPDVPAPGGPTRLLVEAVAPLPVPGADAAFVLLVEERPEGARRWHQLARIATPDGGVGDALADERVRRWLHEALVTGHRLDAGIWGWDAAPEARAVVPVRGPGTLRAGGPGVVVCTEGTTLDVPRRLDPDDVVGIELVRRLAAVDGVRVVPLPLATARWIGPGGVRLPAMLLTDLPGTAEPAAARLRPLVDAALREVPGALDASLADARALGTVARELHAALGRPVAEGMGASAIPAARRDIETWALEATDALAALDRVVADPGHPARPILDALRDHVHTIVTAAGRDPGLVHRIHGAFGVDAMALLPDGTPRVTGFAPAPTVGSPSPWHDVASLLVSLTWLVGDVVRGAGDDDALRTRAWRWEREARRAALDGYGTGGGAGHALVALFEIPLVARRLLAALRDDAREGAWIALHALERLARAAV